MGFLEGFQLMEAHSQGGEEEDAGYSLSSSVPWPRLRALPYA